MPGRFSFPEFVGRFAFKGKTNFMYRTELLVIMKKMMLAFGLLVSTAIFTAAQSASSDYKKAEGYVGYSNGQVDTGIDTGNSVNAFFRDRANFNGVNVSGVYNFGRYLGAKGDLSATYNSTTFTNPVFGSVPGQTVSFDTKNSLYNFVGG